MLKPAVLSYVNFFSEFLLYVPIFAQQRCVKFECDIFRTLDFKMSVFFTLSVNDDIGYYYQYYACMEDKNLQNIESAVFWDQLSANTDSKQ